jgi:hypothetical protein
MRNSFKITLIFLFLVIHTISSQEKLKGNRQVNTEDRNISDFSAIEIIDNVTVFLISNEKQSVSIEADSNLQSSIISEVKNGTLTIRTSEVIGRHKSLNVYIKVSKSLHEISTYNNAIITSKNTLNIDDLIINTFDNSTFNLKLNSKTIELNGKTNSKLNFEIVSDEININLEESSTLKATINAKKMHVNCTSKTAIILTGNSDYLEMESSGNSSFKGSEFKIISAIVKANNSSSIYINVSDSLELYSNNSSEIHLYSDPKIIIHEFYDKSLIKKREFN